MVENTIALDCVFKLYAKMNRSNLSKKGRSTNKEMQTARNHLQDVPTIQIQVIDDDDYAMTENEAKPQSIILNQSLVDAAESCTVNIRHFRYAFLLWITILHEMAHRKIRTPRKRQSPKKVFPNLKCTKGESGQYFEKNLLGGVVTASSVSEVSHGLFLSKWIKKQKIKYRIDDKFVVQLVSNLIDGVELTDDEFVIPDDCLEQVTKQSKKRKRESDSSDDELQGKEGKFEMDGKMYVV